MISVFLARLEGFDLPCGAGHLAALGCPRQPIHYRSDSNPTMGMKNPAAPDGATGFLARLEGFEPPTFWSVVRFWLFYSVFYRFANLEKPLRNKGFSETLSTIVHYRFVVELNFC